MSKRLLFLIVLILIQSQVFAFLPVTPNPLEIKLNEFEEFEAIGNTHFSKSSGLPLTIFNLNYDVDAGTPLEMATSYLNENASHLGIDANLKTIRHDFTREAQGSYSVRFYQYAGEYEVYKSDITISVNKNNQIVFVTNGYKPIPEDVDLSVNIPISSALNIAKDYLGISEIKDLESVETFVYASNSTFIPVHKVDFFGSDKGSETWEILVNAQTGEVFRAEDKNCYSPAYVFDPDPITMNRTNYGATGYTDNFDADNDSLHASLVLVDFDSLRIEDGNYVLKNDCALIDDFDDPFTGIFEQPTDTFLYSRDHNSFEAVNIFHHATTIMRYLRDTLEVDVWPYQYSQGIRFDPSGFGGAANAFYSSGGARMAFGSPNNAVDAGEDHAIVIHEMGHGLHDWITHNLSQNEGLSEGVGDYWAQSYTRSLGIFEPTHPHYDYFGRWGIQPLGSSSMRVTDFSAHYPEGLIGQVHYDGQLWSSSLMSIYDLVGKEVCDRLLIEALAHTDGNSGQVTAAMAFMQADIDLYNSEHMDDIIVVFNDRGYLESSIIADFSASATFGGAPLSVFFLDLSSSVSPINSWSWDFDNDGAEDSDLPMPTWEFTEVGIYTISLTVTSEIASATETKENYVVVNGGTLVYDNRPENADNSGNYILDFLDEQGITDVLYSDVFPSSLVGFDNVFLSYGNMGQSFASEYITQESQLNALDEYITDGGNVYLECGLPFILHGYPTPTELYNTAISNFGISSSNFNTGEVPLSNLTGAAGTIAEGLTFESSNQVESWHIEGFTPAGGASELLNDENLGTVAVLNESIPGSKTVVFSYSISQLVDGDGDNTRDVLLGRICAFFEMLPSYVNPLDELIPENFELYANYPNPFNPETTISYDVPFTSNVSITVYDVLGREVTKLLNGVVSSGSHTVTWNGRNSYSNSVASGVYFLRMDAKSNDGRSFNNTRKMLLLK
jgi:PKD repeat protein